MKKTFLEDYAVGERWVTPARTVTEADVVNYAGLTGDWHPVHTDRVFAEKTPFGERIAHGLLVLAIGSTLIFRLGENRVFPEKFIAFYGMDRVRFMGPVRMGDTIHCEVEVSALIEKDTERGLLVAENAILNHKGETVVRYDTRALVGRRPPAPAAP